MRDEALSLEKKGHYIKIPVVKAQYIIWKEPKKRIGNTLVLSKK